MTLAREFRHPRDVMLKREEGIRIQILTERERKAEDTTQSADIIRWQEHESLVFNIPV